MNQASFIILSLSLLPGAVLFSSNGYAAGAIETQATVGQDPSTPSPLFIHYENGLIHAHIDNVPLGNVLRELETRTRARFTLSDLAIANRPVSAVVEAMPFEQGVKEILAGYSYAIYRVGGVPKILVLSTPVVQRTAGEEPTDLVETIQSQLTFNQCVPGTGKSVTCPSVDKHEAVRLEITGPSTSVTSTPNPFGIVVDMTFTSPTSKTYKIPVVYAADGNEGSSGNVWFAYFSPNESGTWNVSSTSSNTSLNGWTGSFSVTTTVPFSSPDLRQKGWLRSEVGKFYPKFDNGTYFVKGGSDDPEAFLGYPGCTDYQANPTSAVAAACPALGVGTSTSRTTAVNQRKSQIDTLNTRGNNSTYMILNTLKKGDSRDIYPFLGTTTYGTNVPTSITTTATGSSNVNRFNLAKMNDWDEVIQYAEQRGVVPYLVFNDDSAYHAYNNEIYYRYLVGRLGYHVAVIWNLGEESNEIHGDIQRNPLLDTANLWDANRHILTVHLKACYSGFTQAPCVGGNGTTYTNSQGEVTADSASGPITTFSSTAYPDAATDLRRKLHPLIKNTRLDAYSYQVNEGGQNFMSAAVIKPNLFQLMIDNRAYMEANNVIRPIMIDELPAILTVADAGSRDAQFRLRRDYYYPTYIGGGGYEFHYGFNPVFPTHVATIQTQVGYARKLMDTILSAHFVNMTPMPSSKVITASGSGKAVCAERLSNAFVCYLERGFASNPSLNLSAHASTKTFAVRWYNPRSGAGGLKGSVTSVTGGGTRSLGNPPSAACAADTSTNFDRDCVVYGI